MNKSDLSLPYSKEIEKVILGSIIQDSNNYFSLENKLLSRYFFIDHHRYIYDCVVELDKQSRPIDLHSIGDELKKSQKNIELSYLIDLIESSFISTNLDYYVEILIKNFFLREIISACKSTIDSALKYEDGSIVEFINKVEKQFFNIISSQEQKGLVSIKDLIEPTIEDIESRLNKKKWVGVSSGFRDLDDITGGWQKSDLIIIAARPAMGKTALGLNCAMNAVKNKSNIAFFTLEMSKTQLMLRLISCESHIDSSRLRKGILNQNEQDKLMYGARQINDLKSFFFVDETPSITLGEIRSKSRRMKKESGLDLIIIDYLQLIRMEKKSKETTREREISEISMGLKALAKELDIPIIALAQLNRSPDLRPDKRPKLSDLRESGSMEQDADLILFIYRDEYYNKNSEHIGTAEIIIGKNRHGPVSTINLAYLPNFVSFHNLSKV